MFNLSAPRAIGVSKHAAADHFLFSVVRRAPFAISEMIPLALLLVGEG